MSRDLDPGELPRRSPDRRSPDHGQHRCAWAESASPLLRAYHDREWGTPLHGRRRLFELLCLEGAQAGLSWSTVLARREGYRLAFAGFEPDQIGSWGEAQVEKLVKDPGIVRNRAKIAAVIGNARALRRLEAGGRAFDEYLWSFVGGAPLQPGFSGPSEVPARSPHGDALSKGLRELGFGFVGPTIVYAFMQAAGLSNDHTRDCFRHRQLSS